MSKLNIFIQEDIFNLLENRLRGVIKPINFIEGKDIKHGKNISYRWNYLRE